MLDISSMIIHIEHAFLHFAAILNLVGDPLRLIFIWFFGVYKVG